MLFFCRNSLLNSSENRC